MNRQKRALHRKWSARAWWIGFHVYDYAVLSYCGAISPKALGTSDFITLIVVAICTVTAYATLQFSSPGFVEQREKIRDVEAGDVGEEELTGDGHEYPDAERLVPPPPLDVVDTVVESGRFCDICNIVQPMRTKHCLDCDRCVRQYDHHCDCVGTCVGQDNRRLFVFYLFLQVIEAFEMIGVAASAFTLQNTVDEWFKVNCLFIVAWLAIVFVLLVVIPLLCYQLYLITTNQTSWENARSSNITYLQDLRDDNSPFDQGVLRNWWNFICHRSDETNRWVHRTRPAARNGSAPSIRRQQDFDEDEPDTSVM